jgi:ABC-type nitrate/sulfonate/bicarbonate transport system ATPase subunit
MNETSVRNEGERSQPVAPARAATLSIRGLSKTYRLEGRPLSVLERIDLEVPSGGFTSIVGASGCGKSTLLRLIVGLDDQYEGAILLDGQPIRGPGLERGIVFQEHRLFPWLTVEENVALGLEASPLGAGERRTAVREHVHLVGLQGFERAYPRELSGGMAQRAAIARALVGKPDILLLDEPLGALDALTRVQMQNELLRLWRTERVTMILVTHDIEEAVFLGQEVVVMDARPGRIRRRLQVDRPYPRDRTDPELARLRRELLAEFQVGDVVTASRT